MQELNLLDRFLFAEAMDNPENVRVLLEIILGKEILLAAPPQTEKEKRLSPQLRCIRMDVLAQDKDNSLYDTEVQQQNTLNLPHRSRFYQALIDSKLLGAGEVDFRKMSDVYLILIAPFDLFGMGKYRYTFRMECEESPGLDLKDGAVRIFLNTHGTNDDEVNPELVELLKYIESSTAETASRCTSERIQKLQERIQLIKSSEEVGLKYMQEWEEKIYEQREAKEQGISIGEKRQLKKMVDKKLKMNKSIEIIAAELDESEEAIRDIINWTDTEASASPAENRN
ncbi:MAG: Rpn family recombination-promoting nuclease/putative transposase [Eubacteriales bacterium]|nr:Rpn family recombination-promoting nuclease/putative transposase [Eubacteriales bacterium]